MTFGNNNMKPSNTLSITTLTEEWCDKDMIMLHACFQLLADCVEKENLLDGHIDWDHDEDHRIRKTKIQGLYDWWQLRKVDPEGDRNDLNESNYAEDTTKLIELMSVRKYLWT